jgi:hypothetical protein
VYPLFVISTYGAPLFVFFPTKGMFFLFLKKTNFPPLIYLPSHGSNTNRWYLFLGHVLAFVLNGFLTRWTNVSPNHKSAKNNVALKNWSVLL